MMQESKYKYVAKKLETMLQSALEQLKAEQKLRKEANAEINILKKELHEKKETIIELDCQIMMFQNKISMSYTELSKRHNIIENLKGTVQNVLKNEKLNNGEEKGFNELRDEPNLQLSIN